MFRATQFNNLLELISGGFDLQSIMFLFVTQSYKQLNFKKTIFKGESDCDDKVSFWVVSA